MYEQVRKPYTISKQREKWTEEEHQRFLEALKLYGRGWRQIKGKPQFEMDCMNLVFVIPNPSFSATLIFLQNMLAPKQLFRSEAMLRNSSLRSKMPFVLVPKNIFV